MKNENGTILPRRNFLGECASVIGAVGTIACGTENRTDSANTPGVAPKPSEWWKDSQYVEHKTVDSSRLAEGVIRARVDGVWTDFEVGSLPERYVEWSLRERIERLEKLAQVGFDPEDLDGPHNGCVATYGGWQRGSVTSLNTAYKGIGFVPKPNRLEETLAELSEATRKLNPASEADRGDEMTLKTDYLRRLYGDSDRFDRTKHVSLELFSTPKYATHTFLNMMANPITSFSFLAFPTFEVRAVAELLHPDNPKLDAYQKNAVAYVNAIHNFAHGGRGGHMTCVYHVLEVYNDSPGEPTGRGRRLV